MHKVIEHPNTHQQGKSRKRSRKHQETKYTLAFYKIKSSP